MEDKIFIKFEHRDILGNSFVAESNINLIEEDSVLNELGSAFNSFLKQIGYPFFDKEYILMESLDGEEYELLADYLSEIRKEKSKK